LELGENNVDLIPEDKKKIVDVNASQDLDFQWKVGKKDPRHQLGIEETLTKIDQAVALGSKKVVLEANEGLGVGIYDEKGSGVWTTS
jgi:phosphosulfolactate synthase